jgi:F-type H+-transporting ATPase subunit epsilon
MAKHQRKFTLDILTPDGPVLSTTAVSLIAPAVDGQIGILGGHSPLLAMIGAGRLSLEDEKGQGREFFVSGGFMDVRESAVSVLPEQCLDLSKILPHEAQAELDRAQQMPKDSPESRSRRQDALDIAQAKVRVGQQKRIGNSE